MSLKVVTKSYTVPCSDATGEQGRSGHLFVPLGRLAIRSSIAFPMTVQLVAHAWVKRSLLGSHFVKIIEFFRNRGMASSCRKTEGKKRSVLGYVSIFGFRLTSQSASERRLRKNSNVRVRQVFRSHLRLDCCFVHPLLMMAISLRVAYVVLACGCHLPSNTLASCIRFA